MGGVHLSGLLRRSGEPRASNHDLRVSPCPAPPSPPMLGQVAGEVKFEASCVLGSDRPAMNGDCTYLLGDPGMRFPYSFFICNVGVVTTPPPRDCCIHHRRSLHRWSPLEAAAPGGSEGPWWERVGESPPRPCSTLTLPVPASCGPGASRRRSEFRKSQEKNYLARASPGRDQMPIGVGGVLSLSGDSCHEGPLMGLLFWLARISPEMGLRDGLWV